MSFRRYIAENLVLGLEDYLKHRPSRQFLNEARQFSYKSSEEIEGLQLNKLKDLVKHAYEHVPFYRKRFDDCGFNPYTLSHKCELEIIPPLTRDDLRDYFDKDLRADNYDPERCYKSSTGGSTGQPVSFMRDLRCLAKGTAASYAGWEMSGWSLGQRTLTIWGNPTTVRKHWKKPSSRVKTFLCNQRRFPAYELKSADAFKELTDLFISFRPKYITGYTRAIYLLAEHLKDQGITLDSVVQGVLTTAETIYDYQRDTIRAFIGPVYDCYGCGEIHSIAYQCSARKNYHTMDWHVLVQYQQIPDVDEETLLITDLDNFAFPLIRYKNGDMALPSNSTTCECGRNTGQLRRIAGRTSDIIQTKSGGYFVIPSFLGSTFFKGIEGILEYQFVKTLNGNIQMRIKSNELLKQAHIEKLKNYLVNHLSNDDEWEIRTDLPIIYSSSGKAKVLHREEAE